MLLQQFEGGAGFGAARVMVDDKLTHGGILADEQRAIIAKAASQKLRLWSRLAIVP
jgi:hypothetical protein